jgi:transcriptional regulator with XRE-family HTH domain
MSKKEIEKRLRNILEIINDNEITAYEIAEGTGLNHSGIHRILTGETKHPRSRTIEKIFDFVEDKITGRKIKDHPNYVKPVRTEESTTKENELLTAFNDLKEIIEERDQAFSTTLQLTIINTEETKIMANISAKKLESIEESLRRLENTIANLAKNRSS